MSNKNRKAVIGISALYHDSGVALVDCSGQILFAAHEERYSRIKHDKNLPVEALKRAKTYASENNIDVVDVFYFEKPELKKDRQIFNLGYLWAAGADNFHTLKTKVASTDEERIVRNFARQILGQDVGVYFKTLHHMSHACSAFLPSPFDRALTVVLDGVGEWETSSAYLCEGKQITKVWSRNFPQSLGLFYSAFTQLCGFRVNSGEYKLMGLAPYGEPKYLPLILEKVLVPKPAPDYFELDLSYFDFLKGERMVSDKLLGLFGLQGFPDEDNLQKVHLDIAASAQKALENVTGLLVESLMKTNNHKDLCLAGGVALNCVNNSQLVQSGAVDNIFIQPAAGDAGGALGAALDGVRKGSVYKRHPMPVPYLGSGYSKEAVLQALEKRKITTYEMPEKNEDYLALIAEMLIERQIGGWYWGRSEFGPRALGARSIIARPDGADMQSRVNLKVKFRESFRPFAPVVIESEAARYFEECISSPYMLRTYRVQDCEAAGPLLAMSLDEKSVLNHLGKTKGGFQSITHVDGSARVQTVNKSNGLFYDLLEVYRERVGNSVLINTSFNVRGEPIVETPLNALDCFLGTDIDFLAIQGIIVRKSDLPDTLLSRGHRLKYDLD